jgi:hypothetical protein
MLAIDTRYAAHWELQVLCHVAAPAAVQIRPDGYGTWMGVALLPDCARR